MRRRVLLLHHPERTQAEEWLAEVLPRLDRSRFELALASPASADGAGRVLARRTALPWVPVPTEDPDEAASGAVRTFRGALRSQRIQLVHALEPSLARFARAVTRGLSTVVLHAEPTLERLPPGPALPLRPGLDFEALERACAEQPAEPAPERPRGAFCVLIPARFQDEQELAGLGPALAALAERPFPPIRVWITGSGPQRRAFTEAVRAFDLEGVVHWLGEREDAMALLRSADAIYLPAPEPAAIPLLRALGAGRPVVTETTGASERLLREGETGLCIPRGAPLALARALDQLRTSPELRTRLGAAAAADVRLRFDVGRSASGLEALYRSFLQTRQPARVAYSPDRTWIDPRGGNS